MGKVHYVTDATDADLEFRRQTLGKDALGAYRCGTRIVKAASEANDTHRDGAGGTVRGSVAAGPLVGYWVEWDDLPGQVVFVAGPKVRGSAS